MVQFPAGWSRVKQRRAVTGLALATLIIVAGVVWFVRTSRDLPTEDDRLVRTTLITPSPTPLLEGYELDIPELSITVPIVTDVPGTNEKEYLKALAHGVAHYKGTVKPGEKGNSFLFGHSDFYKEQEYKVIFKELNKLTEGKTFSVRYKQDTYTYRVVKSKIIADTDTSVLEQPKEKDKEIVTLMTCWPPGTIAKRYIVQGERVSAPAPSGPLSLPSAKTSFRYDY